MPLSAYQSDVRWESVPDLVATTIADALPVMIKLAVATHARFGGHAHAYYDPFRRKALVAGVAPAGDLVGIETGYAAFAPAAPDWVSTKVAAVLQPVAQSASKAQTLLGGPNPLTTTLLGGLVGSGLGYGAGWLGERFLPEDRFERGKLRRAGAIAGGLAGAVPGLLYGSAAMRNPAQTGGGMSAWLSKWPFRAEDYPDSRAKPPLVGDFQNVAQNLKQAFRTAEADSPSNAAFMPSIPVDAFNNAVWLDVHHPANPWGTRDPYGDNSQPIRTPPPIAALTSGLVTAAANGRPVVSPFEVGLTAAASAGVGLAAGAAFGKVLGVLAGLDSRSQAEIRRAGMWGGILTAAAKSFLGV